MAGGDDPVGALLVRAGVLTEDTLAEVLERQHAALPLASACWALGYADETSLVAALVAQHRLDGIVIERSVFSLEAFARLARRETQLEHVLPVDEDDESIHVVVDSPTDVRDVLMDIQFVTGKAVVPRVGLAVVVARTVRACHAAIKRGEHYYVGPLAVRREPHLEVVAAPNQGVSLGAISVVTEVADGQRDGEADEITKENPYDELLRFDDVTAASHDQPDDQLAAAFAYGTSRLDRLRPTRQLAARLATAGLEDSTPTPYHPNAPDAALELDRADGIEYRVARAGRRRVMVVDDDRACRDQMVRELQKLDCEIVEVASGRDALELLKREPPDVLITDSMVPDLGGFQLCRAIKESRKYGQIGVVLVSAVIESGQVGEEILSLYGADGYFEKPLAMQRVVRKLRQLLAERSGEPSDGDQHLRHALELYRQGQIAGSIGALRRGLEVDPNSARLRFILANLLHRKQQLAEAIDEYEAVLDLKPDFFPALTRLAYLYYRQGLATKAIDTWRRALPVCPDPKLRQNIEGFMRKLLAELAGRAAAPGR